MTEYFLNPHAKFVVFDNRWFVLDRLNAAHVEISAPRFLIQELISLLSDKSMSEKEIISHLSSLGKYTAEEVRSSFPSIVESSIFRQSASLSGTNAEGPWMDYWLQRHGVEHADYSDPNVYDLDKSIMDRYLSDPIPDTIKQYDALQSVKLSHPAYRSKRRLDHLLFFAFGRLREAIFLDMLPVQFKAVPSKGARHPFEAYLIFKDVPSYQDGIYHYRPDEHRLDLVYAAASECPSGTHLVVTAVFERFQWRYRDSWAYKDLYFDLGHITKTLDLLAEELHMTLSLQQEFPPLPMHDELTEEVMTVYRLDYQE